MTYKKIRQLTTVGQSWNIKVRVIRIWESINLATDELMSLDMILMHGWTDIVLCNIIFLSAINLIICLSTHYKSIYCLLQGETIRATIWKNHIDNYKPKIIEGSIYALSNFKVQEDARYRPVKNLLKIVFVYSTNVQALDADSVNFRKYYFEFASRDTLLQRKNIDKQCSGISMISVLNYI